MSIQQISVFLENKTGQLLDVAKLLAQHNINLRALSIADTQNFGILRIIADNPEKVAAIISEQGYICRLTPVVAICVADEPGGFARILSVLSEGNVGIEYSYAFTSATPGNAYVVLRVDDSAATEELLEKDGIHIASQQELFHR